jgi:hypothetical protein
MITANGFKNTIKNYKKMMKIKILKEGQQLRYL